MLNYRRMSGISLIEITISIALVALLLLTGLPTFTAMLSNLRVRSVADSVLGGLQAARTEALKRNRNIAFQLNAETGGAWTVGEVDAAFAMGTTLQTKSASEGGSITVTFSPVGTTQVVFNNLGRRIRPTPAEADRVEVLVANPGFGACEDSGGTVRCLRITVAIGGEVRMCDPNRPSGDPQAC